MNIKAGFNKLKLKAQKNSPEILIVTGVVGVVASAVMACKATRKIDPILDAHKEGREKIQEAVESKEFDGKTIKKSTTRLYFRTGKDLVKLYSPAVTLGAISIGCIFASNNIMRKRNAALGAAYMSIKTAFDKYRSAVREQYGDQVDYDILHGVKTIESEEVNDKGKVVKKKEKVADPNVESDYVKYITKSNSYWEKNPDILQSFLNAQQHFANDKLKAEGKLVLNDVYESLGFEKTKAGMVVGWVYDLKNPSGDNYVQFNVQKVKIPGENGELEDAYAVDFNVDGNIYDLV